jgi:hypothetical protein
MRPDQNPTYRQIQLPLPRKALWQQFPQPTRERCLEVLIQILQQVVLVAPDKRSRDERQD